jgi:ATP-dependent helicase/nuclease subunit A
MDYLDTNKSVMISSPAGSGKTEKLSRRYIALLQKGIDVERILAITFTDKAAAEMKQRILKILREEDDKLFRRLLDRMPLMRVSTIHSFCGTLLRRFSFEASIAPDYKVEDAIDSRIIWEEILYEIMMDAGKGEEGHGLFLQALGEKGFGGLDYLKKTMDYLYGKSPFSLEARTFRHVPGLPDSLIEKLRSWQGVGDVLEGYEEIFKGASGERLAPFEKYFLTDRKEPRKRAVPLLKGVAGYSEWAYNMYVYWKDVKLGEYVKRTERIREIYGKCLDRYTAVKRARGVLDFSDLEHLAYRMLTEDPEWANILYAFDEKTDHILVDEFQDTNNFQWAIIDKLTEEWRSGMGAKREEGIRPTVFFVGDEKQSIYFFRGANVEIFRRAREKLEDWLGDEFCYEEVKENYRSLPAIVEFTNRVFSRTMQAGEGSFPWVTGYTPFNAYRPGVPDTGRVEIILLDDDEKNASDMKQEEADILARRIRGLAGEFTVTDRASKHQRPCSYMDMAILLRKRTHLKKYEEALARYNVPFVAVKGIGFYQEPEVAVLRAFLFFLANPSDDYSLYIILKSPLFHIDEHSVMELTAGEGGSLFSKLKRARSESDGEHAVFGRPARFLQEWLSRLPDLTVAQLIEDALAVTKAWKYFHEDQKRANIKKFIRIVEDLEAGGKSLMKIKDFLERNYDRSDEPKANVNTEGMNAVKIMTVHAAKGLEFPVVFIPGLEERSFLRTDDRLVYEKEGGFLFKSVPEPSIRNQDEDFLVHLAKEEEELKRLFYVAVTRAEDALFLTGHWSERDKNLLDFLKKGLDLERKDGLYNCSSDIQGLSLLTGDDVKMLYEHVPEKRTKKKAMQPIEGVQLPVRNQAPWRSVTETMDIRRRHGKDWTVLGDIIHRIFEDVSKGVIHEADIGEKAGNLLEAKGFYRELREEKMAVIEKQIALLREKGIWQEIILPQKGAYTELPFILEDGDTVYNGRIDRVIKADGLNKVYDYKTFPVKEEDMEYLLNEYAVQLKIYKKAVKQLFNAKDVRSYIIFTYTGDVREV